jgi:hypothetical protein
MSRKTCSTCQSSFLDYYKSSRQIEDTFHQIEDRDPAAYAGLSYNW